MFRHEIIEFATGMILLRNRKFRLFMKTNDGSWAFRTDFQLLISGLEHIVYSDIFVRINGSENGK